MPIDLEILAREKFRVVSLHELVELVRARRNITERMAAITFDDGPAYDAIDSHHPEFGPQKSFQRALEEFRATALGRNQLTLCATSFVIASPSARLAMESAAHPKHTWLEPDSMSDVWWNAAIDQGLLSIANHSWDHLHPALPVVAHSLQIRADFKMVLTMVDADAQIAGAMAYISFITQGRAAPYFAYPFGHSNSYLLEHYFPTKAASLGIEAAFSTEPRPIYGGESLWELPRYTCGHHWQSPDGLRRILSAPGPGHSGKASLFDRMKRGYKDLASIGR